MPATVMILHGETFSSKSSETVFSIKRPGQHSCTCIDLNSLPLVNDCFP